MQNDSTFRYYVNLVFFSILFLSFSCGSPDETQTQLKAKYKNYDPVVPASSKELQDYYGSVVNQNGSALLENLSKIIGNHNTISYKTADSSLIDTDETLSDNDKMELFYSGVENHKSNRNVWNREHVWPKSRGVKSAGGGAHSDLHHLRPTIIRVNSIRGNKDFDYGGQPVHEAPDNLYDSDSFEPRDEVKGDVARILFYMATRYKNKLRLQKQLAKRGNTMGNLCVLLEWNQIDPVSHLEKSRNERIYYRWQYNRNPFIDHPEFADRIWGDECHN